MSSAERTALYRSIERDVEVLRQLSPKRPVDPVLLDEAGLRAELQLHSEEDNPPAELARQERLLKALGLLPGDASLRSIMNAFLAGQIAGFYRPKDGQLYVVSRSGAIGGVERTTFAHEYTHALQDQNFALLQQLEVASGPKNGDRDLAQLALVEGDATLVMTLWAQNHLSPLDLLDLLRSSFDPAQQAALAAMPPFLRDTVLFPYQAGLQFVMSLQIQRGWRAVDDALGSAPESTEQVLHPDKFTAREPPIVVAMPAVLDRLRPGWSVGVEDTLGEYQLRAWLAARGVPPQTAAKAAAGWGGDRVAIFQGPGDRWLLVLVTAWDTPQDSVEFEAAARTAVDGLSLPGTTRSLGSRTYVFIASDPSTLDAGVVAAISPGSIQP
jgi:hypothetical protein